MLFIISLSINVISTEETKTIYVDDDDCADYTYIQDAIDAAKPGDTVFVYNGSYVENIKIDVSIDLVGESKENTIIDGNNDGDVVFVSADEVIICGFTINHREGSSNDAGIRLNSDSNIIIGNNIKHNDEGIFINDSSYNIIENNNIEKNRYGIWLSSSSENNVLFSNTINNNFNGIWLDDSSDNNTINENKIIDNTYDGIMLYDSSDNIICRNTIMDNARIGIETGYDLSYNNTINNNKIADSITLRRPLNYTITHNTLCGEGLYLTGEKISYWNTHTIFNNTIDSRPIRFYKNMRNIDVPHDAVQVILANCSHFTIQNLTLSNINIGVQLGFSSNNVIKQNIITSNTVNGLYLFNSTKNIIEGNTILTNKRSGIRISNSSQNVIKENNIEGNDYGIVLESSSDNKIIRSKFKGNHWSGIVLDTASNENTIYNNQIMESGDRSVLIIHSSGNLIGENNFIDNQLNPLIYRIYRNYVRDLIDIFHNTFNKWEKNYWNDWPGGIPRPIELRLNIVDTEEYPIISFPWLLFDWHPAENPYDIDVN